MAFFILLVLFLKTTARFQVLLSPFTFAFCIFAAVSASLYYLTLFTGFGDSQYKRTNCTFIDGYYVWHEHKRFCAHW
jgi:hypothetical protein